MKKRGATFKRLTVATNPLWVLAGKAPLPERSMRLEWLRAVNCLQSLKEGCATQESWDDLANSVELAKEFAQMGLLTDEVRASFNEAFEPMNQCWDRANDQNCIFYTGRYVCSGNGLSAIDRLVSLHLEQLKTVTQGQYEQAYLNLSKRIESQRAADSI